MAENSRKSINIALQGGGAHGAFAWGVLDKLIEDGRLDIEGICATSAGTMNACAYAYGNYKGGPDMARQKLHDLWWKIHKAGERYSPLKNSFWRKFFPYSRVMNIQRNWAVDSAAGYFLFDTMTRLFSPYQYNPFDINPLREVVQDVIDFDTLRHCDCTKLFVSTTHVRTGKVRVFHTRQLSLDVAMASACLPFLFKAVEIDGEHFWDGGYMGNPALFPLFYETDCRDVMIVHINPIEREELPVSAPDIMNRINEISFNSSLLKEMRAIAFVKKLLEHDMLKEEYKNDFKDILLHSIRADEAMKDLSVASKFDTSWDFLTHLRDKGRDTMSDWLDVHFDRIGHTDTVNLHDEFLYSVSRYFDDYGKTSSASIDEKDIAISCEIPAKPGLSRQSKKR